MKCPECGEQMTLQGVGGTADGRGENYYFHCHKWRSEIID